jgi:hypothetical protein
MSSDTKQSPEHQPTQADRDNRAEQLNPDSEKYWKSRGYPERPADWKSRSPQTPPPARKK